MNRTQGFRNWTAFLYGLCAPFPVLGPEIIHSIFLSPVLLAGGLYTLTSLPFFRLTRASLWLILLWLIAFFSAAVRFEPGQYILSYMGFVAVSAPLMFANLDSDGIGRFFQGLIYGVFLTLIIVFSDIASQTLGLEIMNDFLAVFNPYQQKLSQSGNSFLWYIRPSALFREPAHLAIFLASYFFAVSIYSQRSRVQDFSRKFTQIAILFVGSLAGIFLLLIAMAASALQKQHYATGLDKRTLVKRVLIFSCIGLPLVLFVLVSFPDTFGNLADRYTGRINQMFADLRGGNLTGSEGSRANAYLALQDYWQDTGIYGFFFGTGYANYEGWLLGQYGYLSGLASFARGHVDSILVVLFLSTGVFGFLAYCAFIVALFNSNGFLAGVLPIMFVLVVNFATGSLLDSVFWLQIFAIKLALRQSFLARRNDHATGLRLHPGQIRQVPI